MSEKKEPRKLTGATPKAQYVKPAVVATHSNQQLKEQFALVYGQTHVDLFG